ncbi:transcriptional regulator, AraC family [Kribbella flavida DSM 17836]|uniref:Transcriptional regulator, AraC family n=1 Tax=Kribbella flavida (strain DSM 17836 / JCM 10339 / NBRC 14399) TaxID=479435 RepID=D2PQA1_KRIFD|nr:helix-turn-helix domain-containing protein [Kribbella flavida]ADB34803.1 transcriptional regulator, AraC family [Kribbella flavida DSM 17836]
MHTVAVLALDQVVPFDLGTPVDVFGQTRLPGGRAGYRVRVCGATPTVDAGAFELRPPYGLEALAQADTIVIPGSRDLDPPSADVVDALREAAAAGARIASICVGAFALAATGLLDGQRATTHWYFAELLAERHPEIDVDPNVLYVDNGQFLTSAGVAAGLDLCLHLVRRDHGSSVAADAARMAVMPLEREGGQAQFIVHDQPPSPRGSELEPLLGWMEEHCARDLTVEQIAAEAGMSARTLNRRFREQTGTTPLQWLLKARIRQAQGLLETTGQPVDRIAGRVGFGSPAAFRERFKRVVGTTPNAYRSAFRGTVPNTPGDLGAGS